MLVGTIIGASRCNQCGAKCVLRCSETFRHVQNMCDRGCYALSLSCCTVLLHLLGLMSSCGWSDEMHGLFAIEAHIAFDHYYTNIGSFKKFAYLICMDALRK